MEERRRHWRGPQHPATCTCVKCSRARIERLNPNASQPPVLGGLSGKGVREELARRQETGRLERFGQFKADPKHDWRRPMGPLATVFAIIVIIGILAAVVTAGSLLT